MSDNKLTINIGSRLDSRFPSAFKQADKHIGTVNQSLDNLGHNKSLVTTHKNLSKVNTESKKLKLSARAADGFASSLSKIKVGAAALTTVVTLLSGGMMGQSASGLLSLNKELKITEQQLGVTSQSMQVWSKSVEPLGFGMEKMRDIFKDTADKMGDFVATGGGEAKDLVERLGLDIEKLKNQSPDKILLSIGHALNTVQGITQNEKVFLLEAIANDASALLPLLKDNASALEDVQKKMQLRGQLLSQPEIDLLNNANAKLKDTKDALSGLKHQIGLVGAEFLVMGGPGMAKHIDALNQKIQDFDLTIFVATIKHNFLVFEETSKQATHAVMTQFNVLFSSLSDRWPTEMATLSRGWDGFSDGAKGAFDTVIQHASLAREKVKSVFAGEMSGGELFNEMADGAETAFSKLTTSAVNTFGNIKAAADKTEVGSAYLNMWSEVGDGVDRITGGMLTDVKARFDGMRDAAIGGDPAKALTPWAQIGLGIKAIWDGVSKHMTVFYTEMAAGIRYVSTDIGLVVGDIGKSWDNGFGILKEVARTGWDAAVGVVRVGLKVLQGDFSGAWGIIETGAENFVDRVGGKLRGALDGVFSTETFDTMGKTIDGLLTVVSDVADGISYAFSDIIDLTDDLGKAFDTHMWWISGVVDTVWSGIKIIIKNVWDGIVTTIKVGLKLLQGDFSGAWKTVEDGAQRFIDNGTAMFTLFVDTGKAVFDGLITRIKQIPGELMKIVTDLADLPAKMAKAGKQAAVGLANGIKDKAAGAASAAADMAKGALSSVIGVFDINSPSREMHKLGEFVGDGLAGGITAKNTAVVDAATNMANQASAALSKVSQLKTDHSAYVGASQNRIAASKARLDALKAERAAEQAASAELNNTKGVLDGVTTSTGKNTVATKEQTKALKAAEDKRKQAVAGLVELRKATRLSTIERQHGTEAMLLEKYHLEGLTKAESGERISLEKTKAANEKATQQRKQAVTSLVELRKATALSTVARYQGTAAMQLQQYQAEGLNETEAKERISLEKTKAANEKATQQRQQAVTSLIELRNATALSTVARQQDTAAMQLQQYQAEGLNEAEAKERISLEKTKAANEKATQQRKQAVTSLIELRKATALSTIARHQGTAAMQLQQYQAEGLNEAEAKERISLEKTKAANEKATQQRKQAVTSLIELRKATALSTVARHQGTAAMQLQQYQAEGLNEAEAKERISLEKTKAANEKATQQRKQAVTSLIELRKATALSTTARHQGTAAMQLQQYQAEGLNETEAKERIELEKLKTANEELTQQRESAEDAIESLNQQLTYETILLNQGAEAAERFQLKTEGYDLAQRNATISTKKHIEQIKLLKTAAGNIGNTLAEGLLSGDWKSAGKNLLSGLTDTFITPLKKQLGGAISQAMSGGGMGGFSSILGSATQAGGAGGSGIMGMLTGGGMMATLGAGTMGMAAGQALGQTGIGTGLGAAIGNFILPGIGGFLGGALGGVVESLFGGKKKQTGSGMELGYSGSAGVTGRNFDSFEKKRSFWRGTKRWTEYSALDSEVKDKVGGYFEKMESSIIDQVQGFGLSNPDSVLAGLNIGTQSFSGVNAQEQIEAWLKASTVKAYEQVFSKISPTIQAAMNASGDIMGGSVDEISARFEYVGAIARDVSPMLQSFGLNISSAVDQAVLDSTRLSDAMGGLQNMTQGLQAVYQSLMSPSEQFSSNFSTAKETVEELNDTLGLSGNQFIDSKEGLLKYIKTLDLSVEMNAELAAEAIKASGAMATFSDSIAGIKNMFSLTIESFANDLLTQQEKHAKYMNETADLFDQLKVETDAGKIAELSEQINIAANNAWSNMTDEQKQDNSNYIKTVLETSSGIATGELDIEQSNQAPAITNSPFFGGMFGGWAMSNSVRNLLDSVNNWSGSDGSHASGLYNVPKDGYRSILHKQELVATAPQAKLLRSGRPVMMNAARDIIPATITLPAANDSAKLPGNVYPIKQKLAERTKQILAREDQRIRGADSPAPQINITVHSTPGEDSGALARKIEAGVRKALVDHMRSQGRSQRNVNYDREYG